MKSYVLNFPMFDLAEKISQGQPKVIIRTLLVLL